MRFLVAEDNEMNAEIMQELLAIENACCDIAGNGRAAIELFKASAPGYYDMILMDIRMPDMDGYDAARAIRSLEHSDAESIPIIAVTANAFADDVRNALAAGMNAHISKPMELEALRKTVEKLKK